MAILFTIIQPSLCALFEFQKIGAANLETRNGILCLKFHINVKTYNSHKGKTVFNRFQ